MLFLLGNLRKGQRLEVDDLLSLVLRFGASEFMRRLLGLEGHLSLSIQAITT